MRCTLPARGGNLKLKLCSPFVSCPAGTSSCFGRDDARAGRRLADWIVQEGNLWTWAWQTGLQSAADWDLLADSEAMLIGCSKLHTSRVECRTIFAARQGCRCCTLTWLRRRGERIAEGAVEGAGILGGVRHDGDVAVAIGVQRLPNCAHPPVHHVAWRHHVRARPRLEQAGSGSSR